MEITEVRIYLADPLHNDKLRAYAEVTFSDVFVLHEVRIVTRPNGQLLVAMPSRIITDHCPECTSKNQVTQRFCGHCGYRLDWGRPGSEKPRHDYAHPITAPFRKYLEFKVLAAYRSTLAESAQSRRAVSA